ncbi:hypothetical protein CR513_62287, partial [Mucuna pruriens]
MDVDYCNHVKRCLKCQVYANNIHVSPSTLHNLTTSWPFSMLRLDMIGPIEPKASNGHRFILMAIDYFTKWVEAASYASMTRNVVIRHHNFTPYRTKMNEVMEAVNKNIKKMVQKMVVTYKDWHKMLPYSLHGYRTSIQTSTRATPYSLVYGMEAIFLVEVEIPSLRVSMEAELGDANWAQACFDQLNLIEEKEVGSPMSWITLSKENE